MLHEEAVAVARHAASEAVIDVPFRVHVERRGLLLMERTQSEEVSPRPLEIHVPADQLDHVDTIANLGDDVVRHLQHSFPYFRTAIVTPLPPSAGSPRRNDFTRSSFSSCSVIALRSAPVPLP